MFLKGSNRSGSGLMLLKLYFLAAAKSFHKFSLCSFWVLPAVPRLSKYVYVFFKSFSAMKLSISCCNSATAFVKLKEIRVN